MSDSEKSEEGYWINAIVFKTSDDKYSLAVMFDATGRFKKKDILSWSPRFRLMGLADNHACFKFLLDHGLEHRWLVDKWVNKKAFRNIRQFYGESYSEKLAIKECTETIVRLQTRLSDKDAVEYKMFIERLPFDATTTIY